MDINMPVMNGMAATRVVTARFPEIKVIGLSIYDDVAVKEEFRKAGGAAWATKGESASELVKLVQEVRRGAPR